MNTDKISIILPVFNAEKYLIECLESIVSQSYTNWELLAINDFSTDNSLQLLKEFETKDSRIKVAQNSKKGIISALQLGYKNSNGNYVTRMDADDIMPIQKIECLHSALSKKGTGYVATGLVKYFSEFGVGNGYVNYEKWLNQLTSEENNFSEIYKECVIPSPCWMIHKTDFDRIGAFNSAIYPEDYELCFRMYRAKLKVVSVNQICHFWRDYKERTSRNDSNYTDNRFLNLKIEQFLKIAYNSSKILTLWGAGKKGKELAKRLIENNIEFNWMSNNEKKIGKDIFGKIIQSDAIIPKEVQLIIAIANKQEQQEIKERIGSKDTFWFC